MIVKDKKGFVVGKLLIWILIIMASIFIIYLIMNWSSVYNSGLLKILD